MGSFEPILILALVFKAFWIQSGWSFLDSELNQLYEDICLRAPADQFFRLIQGDEYCNDVFECSEERQVKALRCPNGNVYNIETQRCEWPSPRVDCDRMIKSDRWVPWTKRPRCPQPERLACNDPNLTCIDKSKFCDLVAGDCPDGSDESNCLLGNDPNGAPECGNVTHTGERFCSKTATLPPLDMDPLQMPQMIAFTFEGPIHKDVMRAVYNLFDPEFFRSPNGCSLRGTFFVSHEFTNYSLVNELHRLGHEIAVQSVSNSDNSNYWTMASKQTWIKESLGQREIMARFADIPKSDIVGFRSPFMKLGGNRQFEALEDSGFVYDSSIIAPDRPWDHFPIYPYTLHTQMSHPCHPKQQNCPTRQHSLWEMPLNTLTDDSHGSSCSRLDSCEPADDPSDLYEFLGDNFFRHYYTNRAPMILSLDLNRLNDDPFYLAALIFWLDDTLRAYDDVYFVSVSDILSWMREPTAAESIKFFPHWYRGECKWLYEMKPSTCNNLECQLQSRIYKPDQNHTLSTCTAKCPSSYPWTDDFFGEKKV